jgi:putative hydrolase
MGPKRLRAVRESLAGRFRQPAEPKRITPQPPATDIEQVPVRELLDVDEQYRRLARRGRLPRIAPRRFNPTREAWLPVLHTMREDRHYTALFSNTARAHEMGATRDWVIIYRDDHDHHGRWTVITSNYGKLRGCRIVRGREQECLAYYAEKDDADGAVLWSDASS